MATFKKIPAINRDNNEEHCKSKQALDTNVPRIQMDNIAQVSKENESRMTKKVSQDFSGTESRTLGTLSKLDEILKNPEDWVYSGPDPETLSKSNGENRETNEHRSQRDPHPGVCVSLNQSSKQVIQDKLPKHFKGRLNLVGNLKVMSKQ